MAFGLALKSASWVLRFFEFASAAIILGITSYYLYTLAVHNLYILVHLKAVEGIVAAAVLYTLFALVLVCCLGGIKFFAAFGFLLDLAFAGAFGYVAWVNRNAKDSCDGIVSTPYGTGDSDVIIVLNDNGNLSRLPSLRVACQLQKVAFAFAIIAAVLFLISAIVELLLARHRKKEKAYSPNNGYTAGSPKRKFWQRAPRNSTTTSTYVGEKNPDALPVMHASPGDLRTSYATDTTAVGAIDPPSSRGVVAAPFQNGNVAGHGLGAGSTTHGYSTTTTTHVPHVAPGSAVSSDGYVRTHQPYIQNPTAPLGGPAYHV